MPTGEPRGVPKTVPGLLVATVLLVGAELLVWPPEYPSGWRIGLWLLGLLGNLSVLRKESCFSWGLAWTLACWGRPESLTGSFLLAVLAASLLQALVQRSWGFLADVLAATLALPVASLMLTTHPLPGWVLIGAGVLAIQTRVGRALAPARARLELSLTPLRWAAWWSATAALWLNDHPAALALCLPGLLGLSWGAQNAVFRVQAEAAVQALARAGQQQEELRRALSERDRGLRYQQQREQLRGLQERLSQLSRLEQLGPLLGEWLIPTLKLRSLALYGQSQSVQCLWSCSPEATRLEQVELYARPQWGDPAPQLLTQPWLEAEPEALLLPLEGCWLYLGRSSNTWAAADYQWLGATLECLRPWLRGLVWEWLRQGQLAEARQDFQGLRRQLDSLHYLLHCAERLLQPLERQPLWNEMLTCLGLTVAVQSACWLTGDAPPQLVFGLEAPGPVMEWARKVGLLGYLAEPDRERWPVAWPQVTQLVCSGSHQGVLLLALAGPELSRSDLSVLQGLGRLLSTSMARAELYHQVLETQQSLERSRQLWLHSQRSLALAQMSAGVAHELNSPLAAVQLALQSSLRQNPDARLEKAQAACSRAQNIITRLGQLAEQEKQLVGQADLVQVVRTLLDQLPGLPALHTRGPASVLVAVPPEELQKALLPVLVNALEAGSQIHMEWSIQGQEGCLSVHDNGPGVPPQDRARLGQPFFTTKTIGRNMGLGLATLDQICRRQGGRWRLESQPEVQGTRVHIAFPMA